MPLMTGRNIPIAVSVSTTHRPSLTFIWTRSAHSSGAARISGRYWKRLYVPATPPKMPLLWFNIRSITCGATPRLAMCVAAVRRKSCSVQLATFDNPSSLYFVSWKLDDVMALLPLPGNTIVVSDRQVERSIACASEDSGTRCVRFVFVRVAGIDHVRSFQLISSHSMRATSPRRCPVTISNRTISDIGCAIPFVARHTAASSSGLSTRSRVTAGAGLDIPAHGFAVTNPRSKDQLNSFRTAANAAFLRSAQSPAHTSRWYAGGSAGEQNPARLHKT